VAGEARRVRVDDEEREAACVVARAGSARDHDDLVGRVAVQHPDLLAADRETVVTALGARRALV
jgi:hypothetical protein